MTGKITEKLLLYKVQTKKDPEAFGRLYDLYIEKIYRFVFFKINSKEETEDIVSEVFLKVWRYLIDEKGNEITSFSGLIYKVARNCLIDHYRDRAKKNETDLEKAEVIVFENKDLEKIFVNQESEKILESLKKLKQDYQEVLTLKYMEELSVSEIAVILGMSNVGVRVTLHRAIKKLKELVGE